MHDVTLVDTGGIDTRKGLGQQLYERSGLANVQGLEDSARRMKRFTKQSLMVVIGNNWPEMVAGVGNMLDIPVYHPMDNGLPMKVTMVPGIYGLWI